MSQERQDHVGTTPLRLSLEIGSRQGRKNINVVSDASTLDAARQIRNEILPRGIVGVIKFSNGTSVRKEAIIRGDLVRVE